jgi:hypothetical protein
MKTREIIYKPTDQENEFIGYVSVFGDEIPIYFVFLGCADNKWHAQYYSSKRYICWNLSLNSIKQSLFNRLNSPENN